MTHKGESFIAPSSSKCPPPYTMENQSPHDLESSQNHFLPFPPPIGSDSLLVACWAHSFLTPVCTCSCGRRGLTQPPPAVPGTGSVCPLSDPCSYLPRPLTIDKNWDTAAPGLAQQRLPLGTGRLPPSVSAPHLSQRDIGSTCRRTHSLMISGPNVRTTRQQVAFKNSFSKKNKEGKGNIFYYDEYNTRVDNDHLSQKLS